MGITIWQSENCGLLAANIPKRYSKLGTAGKTVPGIKSKVTTTENMPKGYFTEGTGTARFLYIYRSENFFGAYSVIQFG